MKSLILKLNDFYLYSYMTIAESLPTYGIHYYEVKVRIHHSLSAVYENRCTSNIIFFEVKLNLRNTVRFFLI